MAAIEDSCPPTVQPLTSSILDPITNPSVCTIGNCLLHNAYINLLTFNLVLIVNYVCQQSTFLNIIFMPIPNTLLLLHTLSYFPNSFSIFFEFIDDETAIITICCKPCVLVHKVLRMILLGIVQACMQNTGKLFSNCNISILISVEFWIL